MLQHGFFWYLFRAFYNQEELNNYIQSHYMYRMNVSHEAINQARLLKKNTKLCRIFLKDKDENDQADDKFFKNLERQGILD